MSMNRLPDYLDHMQQATQQACGYVGTMSKTEFMLDKRTQQAVIFNLQIIGEAASKMLQDHAEFLAQHPDVPWRSMKGMRNRIAHGYFEINLDVVWDTLQSALPPLLERLPAIRNAAEAAAE